MTAEGATTDRPARSWVAWLGPIAAQAVQASGLDGRDAQQVDPESLHRAAAIVLTAGEVEALRAWRARGIRVPAVVVAAAADVIEQRAALEPIAWARPNSDLRVALERFGQAERRPRLVLGGTFVDLEKRTVQGSRSARLTALEASVLSYLAARRGRAIPAEELLREVWGYTALNTNTVPVIIGRIRKKIEAAPKKPQWLLTSRGNGYLLAHETRDDDRPRLAGRAEALAQATGLLTNHGTLWVGGWAGIGKTHFVRALLVDRRCLWLDLTGVAELVEAQRVLARQLGHQLGELVDLDEALDGYAAVVLDHTDDLAIEAVLTMRQRWRVPTVLIRTDAPEGSLVLGRLSTEAAAGWLQRRAATTGRPLPAPRARELAEATAGHPQVMQLIAPLLGQLSTADLRRALQGSAEERVERSFSAAYGTLTVQAREALVWLACLDGPVPLRVLGELQPNVVLQVSLLESAGWLDRQEDVVSLPELLRRQVLRRTGEGGDPAEASGSTTGLSAVDIDEQLATWAESRVRLLHTSGGEQALSDLACIEAGLRASWKRANGAGALRISRALHEVITAYGAWRDRLELARATVERCQGEDRARALVELARVHERRDHRQVVALLDEAIPDLPAPALARARWMRALAGSVDQRDDTWLTELSDLERTSSPQVRLLARTRAAWLRYLRGAIPEGQLVDLKLGTVERLMELGAPVEATDQLVEAVGMLRLTDAPRCLPLIEAQERAMHGVHAPRTRIRLAIARAELLQEIRDDHEAALQSLLGAEALAHRFEPSLLGEIDGVRGTLCLDAGDVGRARACLQRNLTRERSTDRPVAVLSVLLDLAGLEATTGNGPEAHAWLDQAQALGLPRYQGYIELERGTAESLCDRWDAALEHFEQAREHELNGACATSLALRALAACAMTGRSPAAWESWLEARLEAITGRLADDTRQLWALWRTEQVAGFQPRSGLARVDQRLLLVAQRANASS